MAWPKLLKTKAIRPVPKEPHPNQLARDVKRIRSRGKDLEKLKEMVKKLANDESSDPKHRDHRLIGPWQDCRDCHVDVDGGLWAVIEWEYLREYCDGR